jgi:hypothetical protein
MQMHVSRFLRKWYANATRPTRHANPCRFSSDWLEPQPYSHSQQQTASQHSHTKTGLIIAPGPPQTFTI